MTFAFLIIFHIRTGSKTSRTKIITSLSLHHKGCSIKVSVLHMCCVFSRQWHHGGMQSDRVAHHCTGTNPHAIHFACQQIQAGCSHVMIERKYFLRISHPLVNCMPVLDICSFRGKPSTFGTQGALHHLHEILANISLSITSATRSNNPGILWNLNICLVDFSHLLHSISFDIDPPLSILVVDRVAHLCIEMLDLRGWISFWAHLHTSPQNRVTNLRREGTAYVRERSEG